MTVGFVFLAQGYALVPATPQERQTYAFAASVTCPTTPGNYVAGGTLNATTNSYWQPPAGTLAAGSTSITLGTQDTGGGGAGTGVSTGDELLIMQMQDGTINTSNSSAYGSGGTGGTGFTSLGNAGLYEYVSVSQAGVNNVTTGTLTIQGIGAGSGLKNSYYEATATNQRYQIIRVPQYTTATLSGNFKAAYWDGNTGGVAAIDMASTLNLGGASIYATGDGFRGGGFAVSGTSPTSVLNTDYVDSAAMNGAAQPAFGTKGEGVSGSPQGVFYYTTFTTPSAPAGPTVVTPGGSDGYTGGDQGMGAPGNAGGGGTDDNPAANDENTGGGGGGNGGAGGHGGYPWTPYYSGNTSLYAAVGVHNANGGAGYSAFNSGDLGGRGGSPLSSYASVSRVFMGGGGGAGSNNNASNNNSYNNYGSSGGVGGGIILMRLADTSGTAAHIYANGTTGLAPDNDGGGGGGAGGSVIITSPQAFSNVNVDVSGAAGTTAAAAGAFPGNQHGPGGGGAGGTVVTTSSVSVTNLGGAAGTTTPSVMTYGATNGASGVTLNGTVTSDQVPGLGSGAQCYTSQSSGTSTLYTGPYDSGDTTTHSGAAYLGAAYTGSYDGTQAATNNNDFTARAIAFPTPSPQPSPVLIDNSPTGSALSPVGNTFTVASAPSNRVEHPLWYVDTAAGAYHLLSIKAVAPILPAQWTVQVCPDNGLNSPNCAFATGTGRCSKAADQNQWYSNVSASSSINTMRYCYYSGAGNVAQVIKYWTVYTAPTGTYTAFSRYDGYIDITDDQGTPAENITRDEFYAGFIPVGKSYSVVKTNCTGSLSVPASGVCPGGVIQYTLNYANIVAGANLGTEGQISAAFPVSAAGTLKITDDGSASGSNWSTYTNGLTEALGAGLSTVTQASCGITASSCGDTTASTTCTYDAGHPSGVNATKFICTIGGALGQVYPSGFTGKTSSGSLVFAAKVK